MPDERLGQDFLAALSRFKKVSTSFPGSCDLQLVEWTIMRHAATACDENGVCLNVTEIQETLHISRPGVSQSLNSLERKGYIVRQIDTVDRRKIKVTVTQTGRETLSRSNQRYEAMLASLLQQYGAGNLSLLCEQMNQLADVYDRLAKGVQEDSSGK